MACSHLSTEHETCCPALVPSVWYEFLNPKPGTVVQLDIKLEGSGHLPLKTTADGRFAVEQFQAGMDELYR